MPGLKKKRGVEGGPSANKFGGGRSPPPFVIRTWVEPGFEPVIIIIIILIVVIAFIVIIKMIML